MLGIRRRPGNPAARPRPVAEAICEAESMLSLRAHALITGGLFAALIVLGWVGNLLDAAGLIPRGPEIRLVSLIVFFGLSVALMFSAVPLMVQLILGFQVRLGNANRPLIRSLIAHRRMIVLVFWGLIALGLLIAIPAAIRDGAFDATDLAAQNPQHGGVIERLTGPPRHLGLAGPGGWRENCRHQPRHA
jgi:hypothetical protein